MRQKLLVDPQYLSSPSKEGEMKEVETLVLAGLIVA